MPSCNKYGKNKTLKGQWEWVKKCERQSGIDFFFFLRVTVCIKHQLYWSIEEIQTEVTCRGQKAGGTIGRKGRSLSA